MTDHHVISRFKLLWRPAVQRIARREAAAAPAEWRLRVRSRVFVAAGLFAFWTAGIEARLLYLQVVAHADMMAKANRQQLRVVKPPAKRGEIFDRNHSVLAYSVDADTIAADPSSIDDPDTIARAVCRALDACGPKQERAMADKLGRSGSEFQYLARQISSEQVRRVKALNLPGLLFLKESHRYYPNMELAAHVLGYVGIDNDGLAGLEHTFDTRVRGRQGRIVIQTDARGHAMLTRDERPPTSGDDLELTIDKYLQFIAERELRAGVEENNAAGGTAIIMQPQTGEILAMANWPTFNPNVYRDAAEALRRNRAIQDLYEPGSTFKVVTASAALDENIVPAGALIDTNPGRIAIGSRVVTEASNHNYGVLSLTDVIVKSSNVGAIKVGFRVGIERFSRYVQRYGFGHPVSPDFPGESPGIVWDPARCTDSALASMAMGYQVAVTPLQMATAVSSVANGGELIEPRIVRAFVRNGRRDEVPHKVLRRTISPETAAQLTEIMEGVVERGTAKSAQIPGYTIAGKTGTASKIEYGHYSKSDYNASFVGFVPSRKPALTIIVVIDSPHGHGYYGGTVAAPVFKRIAEAALRHIGVGPTLNAAPPVLVARHDTREDDPRAAVAPVVASRPMEPATPGLMPDLRGLSAREALRTLTRYGMSARMAGAGFVADQTPEPGVALAPGDECVLKLQRRPLPAPAGGPPQ